MKKGCYKYLFIGLSAIIILSISVHFFQRWQRHHLFCEVIKMGMSEEEVLMIMDRFGEFGVGKYDSFANSEDTTFNVQPIASPTTSLIYGSRGLELNFRNSLLINVIERYHLEDGIYDLCKQ